MNTERETFLNTSLFSIENEVDKRANDTKTKFFFT